MKKGMVPAVWIVIALIVFGVGYIAFQIYRQYSINQIQNSPAPGAPTAPTR